MSACRAIIGGVVGGISLLVLIIAVIQVCLKKLGQKTRVMQQPATVQQAITSIAVGVNGVCG